MFVPYRGERDKTQDADVPQATATADRCSEVRTRNYGDRLGNRAPRVQSFGKAQGRNVKRITRRQARAWLLPMRKCLRQIRATGVADSIRGYAVTRLHASDDYARIDYCAAGVRALMERICPHIDTAPLLRIEQRLAAGVPLEVEHVDAALRMLMAVENNLIKHSVAEVKEAVMIEQILIEMAEMIEMNEMRKAA